MKCIKCGSTNTSPIDKDGKYVYCLGCNHSFKLGVVSATSDMKFSGVPASEGILDKLTLQPQDRAMLQTHIAGEFMTQWFDGFKAGQMASIVHARKYYDGKNRDDSAGSDTSSSRETGGDRVPDGSSRQHGEAGIDGSKATGNPKATGRITETVNGVRVVSNESLSESFMAAIAELTSTFPVTEITITS